MIKDGRLYSLDVFLRSGNRLKLKYTNDNSNLLEAKRMIEDNMVHGGVYHNDWLSLDCRQVEAVVYNELEEEEK